MSENVVSVQHLTKDYGGGRGVFDVSLDIREGEVFGYLGTNGSGKTTTIRHLMGFLKPDGGTVLVRGMNPWKRAPEVMKYVSYIPGEIAFPDFSTGTDFFKAQARFLGVKDFSYMNRLIDLLELDPSADLKRMSKGMKQKTAIVAALMGDKPILVMDEPTTGLDPLMRETFLELVREEKAKGRTVFMSSHIFEELEDACDRVAIIGDGTIRDVLDLAAFRHSTPRLFEIVFGNEETAREFTRRLPESAREGVKASVSVPAAKTDCIFKAAKGLPVVLLNERHQNLEQYFMDLYRKEDAR